MATPQWMDEIFRMSMSDWMDRIPQREVKDRYGLESHEWTGSLSDRVMAIIAKGSPTREERVNAFLCDSAEIFRRKFNDDLRSGVRYNDAVDFRNAVSHVVENGISLNDDTVLAIKDVDDECTVPFEEDSLMQAHNEIYPMAFKQSYYRESLREGYHDPSEEYIETVYGLEPAEWTGSSEARVRTIINKNSPRMEQQVNDFLRDQVAVFDTGMKRAAEDADFDAMRAHGFTFSYSLRNVIKEAVESGVLINPETMNAIQDVEHNYVKPYGGESLTRQYDHLRELNDARKYYRETVPTLVSSHAEKKSGLSTLAAQEVADFSVITGGRSRGKEQIQLANALEQWTRSMGRDTDGQPVSSSTPSQGSRQGSIAAVLPGSNITVGRQAPRVRSTFVSHKSAPQKSDSYEADDGFEL